MAKTYTYEDFEKAMREAGMDGQFCNWILVIKGKEICPLLGVIIANSGFHRNRQDRPGEDAI